MKKILLILISLYTFSNAQYFSTTYAAFVGVLTNPDNRLIITQDGVHSSGWEFEDVYYSTSYGSNTKRTTFRKGGKYYYILIGVNDPGCNFSRIDTPEESFTCSNGQYDVEQILPENASGLDANGKPICNSGYSNNVINDENVCTLTPDNSNGFTPEGEPDCKSDYVLEEGICIPKPNCEALTNACVSSCLFGVKNHLCTNGVEVTPCECNTPPPPKTNDDGSVTETNSENGNTTTTYPDGSTQTNDINGNPISSTPSTNGTGGTGTNGGSGGTNGIGGGSGTGTEAGTGSGDENDLTPPSVASSCSDTNMTLEQKMLCELNEGMKNQNSEGTPQNSLNNLIKDLVANNSKDNKAINDNIKDLKTNSTITNSRLTAVNAKLNSIKTINQQIVSNGNTSNGFLDTISTGVTAIGDFLTTVTDLISNPSMIGDKLDAQLSALPSKFAQSFVSDTCANIQTISINYHGTEVEFLSQSLIDTYFPVEIMRFIIILTFAMAGFMNFFRSAT